MAIGPPQSAGFRGHFRSDDDARAVYSEAAGIGRIVPQAVAVPRDADDVATLVRWASREGVSLVPRGSGSSMTSAAIGPGVVVDLSRLRDTHPVRAEEQSVTVGAGVTRGEIARLAAPAGLRFPVDPSSGEFATIGGMVSTNAAGARSLRYGSVRPWVQALECVFDDGSVAVVRRGLPPGEPAPVAAIRRFLSDAHPVLLRAGPDATAARRVLKESSGYAIGAYLERRDPLDLLIGSEGTLALVTRVTLALAPAVAGAAVMLLAYDTLERAVDAATACRSLGATACELLDRSFLAIAAEGGMPLPVGASSDAVLVVEVEADGADRTGATAAAHDLLTRLGASHAPAEVIIASDPERERAVWQLRHAASPAIARLDPMLASMQFIEDAAVPPDRLGAYVRGVRAILAREETRGVIFGHAGDAHVHVNPLIDTRLPDWRDRVERILLDVTALVAALGGTLSGEHGDGRLRTPLLDRVWSAGALECFAAIKHAFDPRTLFNPGVKVPLAGQRAVDAVKYDPALAPHSPAARRVLGRVERERAYARFRLDLLDHPTKFPAHGTVL